MFNLSIRWRWRTDNPCTGIERNQENKRTRYLSAEELARLTAVLSAYHDQEAANVVRLLLSPEPKSVSFWLLNGRTSTSILGSGRSLGTQPSRPPNIAFPSRHRLDNCWQKWTERANTCSRVGAAKGIERSSSGPGLEFARQRTSKAFGSTIFATHSHRSWRARGNRYRSSARCSATRSRQPPQGTRTFSMTRSEQPQRPQARSWRASRAPR